MRPSVELAVLRWAVVALFVLQISQFAKTPNPAAAAQKSPTLESLNERLVLERKHDNLNSAYLAHQHVLANLAPGHMLGFDCSRSIVNAASTPPFLGSICTQAGGGEDFVRIPNLLNWEKTGPPL